MTPCAITCFIYIFLYSQQINYIFTLSLQFPIGKTAPSLLITVCNILSLNFRKGLNTHPSDTCIHHIYPNRVRDHLLPSYPGNTVERHNAKRWHHLWCHQQRSTGDKLAYDVHTFGYYDFTLIEHLQSFRGKQTPGINTWLRPFLCNIQVDKKGLWMWVSPGTLGIWCALCLSDPLNWWRTAGTVSLLQTPCWFLWRCTGSSFGFGQRGCKGEPWSVWWPADRVSSPPGPSQPEKQTKFNLLRVFLCPNLQEPCQKEVIW